MRSANYGILLILLFTSLLSEAQSIVSPYTRYGLGEFSFQGLSRGYGMGEIGIGAPSLWSINLKNPALLFNNSFSSFEVAVSGERRGYQGDGVSGTDFTANLSYLAMSFPAAKGRWTTALSLLPYSTVNYNTFSQDSLEGNNVVTQYQGDGGLTNFSWSNGVRIYKTFAIGVKASFIFGNIEKLSRTYLVGEDVSAYPVAYKETIAYSDINFSIGASNQFKLAERRYLNLGAIYHLSGKLEGSRDEVFERYSPNGPVFQTQVLTEDQKVNYKLPRSFGIGISYQNLNKLLVGADLELQQWSGAGIEGDSESYTNTMKFGIGGELTPDYQSVNNYLKRATYRLGFSFKESPYVINSTEINDFGINFGASFPVSGYSSLNAAFKFGWRGTTDNNLIRENYFQFVIGATINDSGWFIKRRYD